MNPNHKQSFPHCDFPLTDTETVHTFIRESLSNKTPISIVRIGDGEGMVLAKPTPGDPVLWKHVGMHFGPETTEQFIGSLADDLAQAVNNADIVGVRDDLLNVKFNHEHIDLERDDFMEHFKRSFKLRKAERNISYPGALRLALTHRFMSTNIFNENAMFGSAWLHFGLSENGALIELVSTQKQIGLISSKVVLASKLEESLDASVNFFQIPDMHFIAKRNGDSCPDRSLPDTLLDTLDSLTVEFRGQLFLVGAGIFGKVYCNRIKNLGGIAIDIGAICDTWIGIASRPLVFRSLFEGSGGEVPDSLLLDFQLNKSRHEAPQ